MTGRLLLFFSSMRTRSPPCVDIVGLADRTTYTRYDSTRQWPHYTAFLHKRQVLSDKVVDSVGEEPQKRVNARSGRWLRLDKPEGRHGTHSKDWRR